MYDNGQVTVFALDCGATNWRLFRVEYRSTNGSVKKLGEPQPSPLTSFIDHRLPAVISLNLAGNELESFGIVAQQQLEDERYRERVREHFKPCIGSYLEDTPLPHQKRFTHNQALQYTQFLLSAVIEQIRHEKLCSNVYDDGIIFCLAYPVHWRDDHNQQIFNEYTAMVRSCFPEDFQGLRFVAEPEGAILCLKERGLLNSEKGDKATLIVDVGGSTTDIVAGRVEPVTGKVAFIGRFGGPFGGALYDAELAKVIADQLKVPASALADDPSALISLRLSGQRLKESLSRQLLHANTVRYIPQRTVTLAMRNGEVYRRVISLDESQFLSITNELDDYFKTLIDNALKNIGLREEEIGQVVLVGGGSQLFTVMAHLRERFGNKKVLLADSPDEIVAQGLGLEYGASMEKHEPTIQFQVRDINERIVTEAQQNISGWTLVGANDKIVNLPFGVTTIGRANERELQIVDVKASRLHAKLRASSEGLTLIDLNSTNGSFVNEVRISSNQPIILKPGDELRFGSTKFICHH